MKISTGLCFLLHLYITLAGVETNTSAGIRKHGGRRLQNQLRIRVKVQRVDSVDNKTSLHLTHGRSKSDDYKEHDAKSRKTDHNRSHLQTIIAVKRTPCEGHSCLRGSENAVNSKGILRRKLARRRRTESVFLAKALNLLDHSKPRQPWDFTTRASTIKPYKQFTNGTDTSHHSSNSTTTLIKNPVKNQQGNRRQQWSDLDSEMRPRFFFNSAPAEFVKQKPSSLHRHDQGAVHLTLPPIHTRFRAPGHLHRIGPVFHGAHNHMHMMKNAGELSPMEINFFAHPVPQHIPGPLNLHIHHPHLHHLAPPPPYAIHINAPPRLEPPAPTNVLSQQLSPVNGPPPIPPDMLGEQMPPINPPLGGEPTPLDVHMMPPPSVPMQPNAPITPLDLPPNLSMMPPPDINPPDGGEPTPLDAHMMPPPGVPMQPNAPITPQDLPPNFSMMPPPDIPVTPPSFDTQGMPPPNDLPMPFMPPPPAVEKVPFPVPVPSPPKVEHVPYPVPVPGPPSIQPIMIPIHVPSPPKIQEVRVPVPSPPEIKNVPVPFPVAVPSPPRVQRIPYPVAFPVKEPAEIQKIFFPIAVPQPSQVRHIPYPIYIRYPPEIRTVPYSVPSPPEPYPVAVPSPPRLMIHREPYPVMYPQKVPFPVPVVVQQHHIHHEDGDGEEAVINGQCIVNLCLNGGTCSAYMNTYRCHCPNGFQGKHCEEQNMCKPNPCRNFGICSQVEHDYECTCTKGFIGKNCDKPDPCIPSPCENGATCSSDGTSYSCTCRIGWMGKNCQVESKCLPLNPCQNGGTCAEAQGTYRCGCSPGWAGLSCEVSAPETLHQSVLCNNCHVSDDHMLEQMKRNKLRNRITNFKKGNVIRG